MTLMPDITWKYFITMSVTKNHYKMSHVTNNHGVSNYSTQITSILYFNQARMKVINKVYIETT